MVQNRWNSRDRYINRGMGMGLFGFSTSDYLGLLGDMRVLDEMDAEIFPIRSRDDWAPSASSRWARSIYIYDFSLFVLKQNTDRFRELRQCQEITLCSISTSTTSDPFTFFGIGDDCSCGFTASPQTIVANLDVLCDVCNQEVWYEGTRQVINHLSISSHLFFYHDLKKE
jgi:hypothetical protein